ncbi:hypothetical protein GLE_0468 [Lysobacter enzymogenes]|uniref:Secreted protein n=1 Tax=Lysobacter enzymogenes TaxID=69 RepID=A0A0S2DBC1_LYSEN|nr:hypothetical protein GLE_0468 [Lysobacter enzymogenes]
MGSGVQAWAPLFVCALFARPATVIAARACASGARLRRRDPTSPTGVDDRAPMSQQRRPNFVDQTPTARIR